MAKKSSTSVTPIDLAPVAKAVEEGMQGLESVSGFVCIANNEQFEEAVFTVNEIKRRKDALQERVEPVKAAAKALTNAITTMTKGFESKYTELEEAYKNECREYLESTPKESWPSCGRLQGGQWVVTVEDQQAFLEHVTKNKDLWYLLSVNASALKSLASAQTTAFSMPGCKAKQSQSLVLGKE